MTLPQQHKIVIGPWRWNPRLTIVAHVRYDDVIDCTALAAGDETALAVIGRVSRRPGITDDELGKFVRLLHEVFDLRAVAASARP